MPPPATTPANLIIAAVTVFRNLVNSIQGTEDPGQQLRKTATSLSEVANVLDRLAASTAAHENQFNQLDQRLGENLQQMDQRLGQIAQQAHEAKTAADEAKTTADEAKIATTSSTASSSSSSSMANRKPSAKAEAW